MPPQRAALLEQGLLDQAKTAIVVDMPTSGGKANFLLLMPYVEGSEAVARWLAQDIDAGNASSLGTVPWKPNERIVGLYRAVADDSARGGWHLDFEMSVTAYMEPFHVRLNGATPCSG